MEDIQKKLHELEILMNVNLSLNLADLQIQVVLDKALEELMKVVGAEAGSLWLKDNDDSLNVEAKVAKGPAASSIKSQKLIIGEGIVGEVMSGNSPLLIEDVKKDPRWARRFDKTTGYQTRTMLCVPLSVQDNAFGAVQLINKLDSQYFNQEDLNLVRAVANIASLSIQNSRLYAKQQQLITNMLDAMVTAVELRSVESSGHATRVSFYVDAVGQMINISKNQVVQFTWGALLHDIGKIGLPDDLLKKETDDFNDEERQIFRRHPQYGARIVAKFDAWDFLPDVYFGVLYHHENYDGTGYPNGQKEDLIPLVARIIRIADDFDHMMQGGVTIEKSVVRLKSGAGTLYDPQLVEIFSKMVEEKLGTEEKQIKFNNRAKKIDFNEI